MLLGINHSFIYDYYVKEPAKASQNFHELCAIVVQILILKIALEAFKAWGESIAEQAETARENYKHKIRNEEDLNWEETLKMRRFEQQQLTEFPSINLYLSVKG